MKITPLGISCDQLCYRFEQEKFQSLLNDLLEGLQSRINQWVEFENLMHQLISWHNDTEKKLQNYSEKGTLEEKTQQYNKFQVITFQLNIIYKSIQFYN